MPNDQLQFVVRATKQSGLNLFVARGGQEIATSLAYMQTTESDYITRNMRLLQEQGNIDIIQKVKRQKQSELAPPVEKEAPAPLMEPLPTTVEPGEVHTEWYTLDDLESMTKKERTQLAEDNLIPAKGVPKDELIQLLLEAKVVKGKYAISHP